MKRILLLLVLAVFLFSESRAQDRFTFNEPVRLRRVGDPQMSPDGRLVAYAVGDVKLSANRTLTHIYIVPTAGDERSHSSPRWSPHRFVRSFNTPTLVTHGELDYRVPVGEGLQLYTALQRRNVESKLVYFPDEGHWILKPQNLQFWHTEVLGWFAKHLNP